MSQWSASRRQFLQIGIAAGTVRVTGCSQPIESNGSERTTKGNGEDETNDTLTSTESDQSTSQLVFEDQFNDGAYDDKWGVKPGHGSPNSTVSENNGSLIHIVEGASSMGAGNITTLDDFSASGTKRLVTRLKTQSTDYSGFGFVLSFGSDGQEGGLTLTERNTQDEHGLRINEWEAGTPPEVLDEQADSTAWTEYSMTVDLDDNTVTSVSRGDSEYDLTYEFGTEYSDVYVIELGNGQNHRVQYDYFRIEEG